MNEPLPPLVGYLVGILTAVVGLIVGLGALGSEEGHIIVSSVGTIIGSVVMIVTLLHHKALIAARVALHAQGLVPAQARTVVNGG